MSEGRLQARLGEGLRRLALMIVLTLMVLSAWGCLLAGLVVVVVPHLGTAGALLAVGGGLLLLVVIILALMSLTQRKDPPKRATASGALSFAAAVVPLLSNRFRLRLGLGAVALVLGLAAIFLPGGNHHPDDPSV